MANTHEELCACGSGKLAKDCCGKEEAVTTCACGSGKPYAECCGKEH